MKSDEFEKEVRELRYRQRRFFRCRKDDPDRPKALQLMRDQENLLRPYIEKVMQSRPPHRRPESRREEFFLAVNDMLRQQLEWAKRGGGSWQMNPAKDAEKKVDVFLAEFDEERKAAKQREIEAERAKQTKLF